LIAPSKTFTTLERLSRKAYRLEERPEDDAMLVHALALAENGLPVPLIDVVDLARIPRVHLDIPAEVERVVDHFELAAEPARPGALAMALRLVAPRNTVE
jgi:hypothetical protein